MDSTEHKATPRRRRRKTKAEIIKEHYLPYIFLLLTLIIMVIFIADSLLRRAGSGATEYTAPPTDTGSAIPTIELPISYREI